MHMILGREKKWMAIVMAFVVLVPTLGCSGQAGQDPVVQKAEGGGIEAGKPKDERAESKKATREQAETEQAEVEKVEPKSETEPQLETAKKSIEPKASSSRIFGWKEWVWVIRPEIVLRAKLDTGARTCSIHATNIETFELDGKNWVKFTICDPDSKTGARYRHKAPVIRVAKLKNDSGGLDTRYVVPLMLQIGDQKLDTEFNLNDRSNMVCEVLIGRNALHDLGAVDASRTDLLGKPMAPAKKKSAPTKK
jgi:hypothetical protein